MATRAENFQAKHGHGIWRRARKTRPCQRYWRSRSDGCAGNGNITAGERYFDLQELDGSAGGFGTYCTCAACANEVEPWPVEIAAKVCPVFRGPRMTGAK